MDLAVKRVRFTQMDIFVMLREIVGCNPFENPRKWQMVKDNLNKAKSKHYSVRAIKSQANNLILKWIKNERTNRARSGIEETYTEKDALLQHVFDLMKQSQNKESQRDLSDKEQVDRDLSEGILEETLAYEDGIEKTPL